MLCFVLNYPLKAGVGMIGETSKSKLDLKISNRKNPTHSFQASLK